MTKRETEVIKAGSIFQIVRKYVLSASAVSIVLGILGIYYTLQDRRTHLTIDTAGESNVLDVVHPISDLAILFQGQDLEKQRANLRVLTIRLMNDGQTNILEDDFDSRIPFGLQIQDGLVVRAQVTGASSAYLGSNLHPQLASQNQILFDKIIFDKGSYVTLEVLVIHNKDQQPKIIALGKIAGLESISVTNSYLGHEQQSFWGGVFQGQPAVQIVRTVLYGLIALLCVIAVGFLIYGIVSLKNTVLKSLRKRRIARLPRETGDKKKKQEAIARIYIDKGLKFLETVNDMLGDHGEPLEKIYRDRLFTHDSVVLEAVYSGAIEPSEDSSSGTPYRLRDIEGIPSALNALGDAKLVHIDEQNKTVSLDPDLKPMIADIIKRLS